MQSCKPYISCTLQDNTNRTTAHMSQTHAHNLLVIADSLLKVAKQVIRVAKIAEHSTLCRSVTELTHQQQILPE